mmetsp:Transcript_4869/g.19516  ORF Transcript_4869/g.19516 Transcript_4869/m.19516 type:complete len:483 (+) Transcript_4869:1142-2590(+)|eukprot:scaffold1253_cov245-Pinguiococcus_pyrenoidosus.AAC.10
MQEVVALARREGAHHGAQPLQDGVLVDGIQPCVVEGVVQPKNRFPQLCCVVLAYVPKSMRRVVRSGLVRDPRQEKLEAGLKQVRAKFEHVREVADDAVAADPERIHGRQLWQRRHQLCEPRGVLHGDPLADARDREEAALHGLPTLQLLRWTEREDVSHLLGEHSQNGIQHLLRTDHHAAVIQRVGDALTHHVKAVCEVVAGVAGMLRQRKQDLQELREHRCEGPGQAILQDMVKLAYATAHAVPKLQGCARHFRIFIGRALKQDLQHGHLAYVLLREKKIHESFTHLREQDDKPTKAVRVLISRRPEPLRQAHDPRHHLLDHRQAIGVCRLVRPHDAHCCVAGDVEGLLVAGSARERVEGRVEERALRERGGRHAAVLHPAAETAEDGIHQRRHAFHRCQLGDEVQHLQRHAIQGVCEGPALPGVNLQSIRAAFVGNDLHDEEERLLRRVGAGVRRDAGHALQDVVRKRLPVGLHGDGGDR